MQTKTSAAEQFGFPSNSLKLKEITIVELLTVSALYFFFVADLANKILIYLDFDFLRISLIPRAFYEILFVALILVFSNRNRITFLLVTVSIFALFILGQIVFATNTGLHQHYIENILLFNKYFFVFIIYFAVYKIQNHPDGVKRVISVMENLFLLNASLAIIGFIFGLDIFRTYINQPYRYGYSGVLWVQNEASILYFLAISYFYYKHFILRQPTRRFYVVLIASFLLGTKAIYLFLVMLLVFHFLSNSNLKTKILTAFLVTALYWAGSWFFQTEQAQLVLAYFVSKMNSEGIWYMLFSGRTLYIIERGSDIISNWSFLNYWIGGQDQSTMMIEMDFFDLFFFMGIIGFVIYFALMFTTIFKFSLTKPFNLFFVFAYLLLAFMGGHFFSSVINALYVCLISIYFYTSQASPSNNAT